MSFTALEWMQVLGFGALLGAAGQVIRAVAGMKKLNDDPTGKFSASVMVVSVLIGAVAGLLGAISLGVNPKESIPAEKLIALLGIGYAGADFIEAFMAKSGARIQAALPGGAAAAQAGTGGKEAVG
jgi:hypothetical protein